MTILSDDVHHMTVCRRMLPLWAKCGMLRKNNKIFRRKKCKTFFGGA
ncbi:hypothetical protein HMPREF0970_00305 [Schaalia odontolytica F0309]|uniref:Uncharacterized protein n=1 Tax=Schaalia odontolytica F0309 TaxID=649742 RepID=D4TWJ5_9ACTO|nr:hypothetical protein HMPREF0970_00305 [Schaalia odontolytica F0309]